MDSSNMRSIIERWSYDSIPDVLTTSARIQLSHLLYATPTHPFAATSVVAIAYEQNCES
jgi:hypothetical protein